VSTFLNFGDRFARWVDMTITKKGILEAYDYTLKLESIELDFAFVSKIILKQKNLSFICPWQKYYIPFNLNF
jgi:bisphosphoglycerate-dependent phosphoglycerate mutase